MRLHVNVDHVATLREVRGTVYPDPVKAALLALEGGADGITVHLREDRRHIKDADLRALIEKVAAPINLEMAATEEMIGIAIDARPHTCTLVPERRAERTTERGLMLGDPNDLVTVDKIERLKGAGIKVSLFIDPVADAVKRAVEMGADRVELHTGEYALAAANGSDTTTLLLAIAEAARLAADLGLEVAAGHGLDYENVQAVARIPQVEEVSIGHSIVSRAVMVGIKQAVREMKEAIARG